MPFKLGPLEIVLILVIIVVIFGVGKLPQVGSAIGKSLRAFKEGQTTLEETTEDLVKPHRKLARKTSKRTTKPAAGEKPA
jgi:sec-independent protein translocase protein TatA